MDLGFDLQGGMDTISAPDEIKSGSYPYLCNVRRLLGGRITARPPLGANLLPSALSSGITSLTRLNDQYNSSIPGYVLVVGAAGAMYVNATEVASGLSGNPLSFLSDTPPNTPQPWCYIADPSLAATVAAYSGYTGPVTGMLKVRSDGKVYKTGIMEPQAAPVVATPSSGVIGVTGVGGSGMTAGTYPLVFSGGGGTGAIGTVTVTTGEITNITVSSPGTNYTSPPTVTAATGGTPPTFTATIGAAGTNWVTYRYTYWSDEGVESNPSPESAPQTVPQSTVTGTQVACNAGGAINPNVQVNSSQYEGNSYEGVNQIRTNGGVSAGTVTDYIVCRNFGLSVPAGVTINGIQATMQWEGQYAGTGILSSVALFYQGNILGLAQSPGTSNSQTAMTAVAGGPSISWGTVPTSSIVNDSTFGVGFQITTAESGGSDRSFIYNFSVTVYYTSLSSTLTCTSSTDPQVTSINIYRQDPGLDNFTFVGRVPNSSPSFVDTLSDLAVAANPQLSFANYEPFPSIDLPRKGVINVGANGACTWVSGDTFNTRWLGGTVILIANGSGSAPNSQTAYELYNRPTSATQMLVWSTAIDPTTGYLTLSYPPEGSNLAWEISAPTLAQQPSPVIWGPTPDNAGSFYFGIDLLNPGDLLWSNGNNFDTAADTNRLYVTSASEMLMNGTVTSELSTVFSTERFWLIYSNFGDAVSTVLGTQGTPWSLVQSAATRGLYMRYAIAALGALIAWRAKDSICLSIGGGPEKIISEPIANLFPRGGQAPAPVTIAGQTVYPPDDTNVKAQTIALVPGYVFYNYQDVNGNPRTLCYDIEGKGWTVDSYTPPVNCHAWAVGDVFQILAGCADGTVRALDSTGTEAGNAIVVTPAINGGSQRTVKRIGGVFLRALAASAVTLAFWANRFQSAITGFSPSNAGPGSGEDDYLIDFTGATGADVQDLGVALSFPLGSGNWLKSWEPDWTMIPEPVAAWRTGMTAYGMNGWLHVPWLRFAYQSTTAVTLKLITDQGVTIPLTIPPSGGVPAKYFTWLPAVVGGTSCKFRMLEWVADAGGTPWTPFAKEMEVAIKEWGSSGPYRVLRPFTAIGGIPESTT